MPVMGGDMPHLGQMNNDTKVFPYISYLPRVSQVVQADISKMTGKRRVSNVFPSVAPLEPSFSRTIRYGAPTLYTQVRELGKNPSFFRTASHAGKVKWSMMNGICECGSLARGFLESGVLDRPR